MGIFSPDSIISRSLNRIGDLMVLNILTIICSIPFFTFGAAMSALYTSALRLTRNEEGNLIKGYLRAFRDNFKQSTIIWCVGAAFVLFMSFDIWLLRELPGTFGQVYRILLFLLILILLMEMIYIFALQARFENTIKNTVKNAAVLSFGKLLPAILILGVTLLPVLVLLISYRFVIVDFLIGLSGPAYLASLYFTPLFSRFEDSPL